MSESNYRKTAGIINKKMFKDERNLTFLYESQVQLSVNSTI